MILDVAAVFGLAGAGAVGLGLFGMLANPRPLQKVLAFNLMGSGAFLMFGAVARRAAAPGLGPDPVPHAMVITGLVVSFAATALIVGLLLRLHAVSGSTSLKPQPGPRRAARSTPASKTSERGDAA
ncbi:MAG: hypothetical protein EA355_03195 [Rhodobacteraceae bacterium]|nr:MAG: hypothetical protein EA355_03195 [Paracoccaceae bacterium]